jgi:hypothetical protein
MVNAARRWFAIVCFLAAVSPSAAAPLSCAKPEKLISSRANGYHYAYAPSIVYLGDRYHAFYCSSGHGGWDDVRYATSADGRVWSAPRIVLSTSNKTIERATCDPSVVEYRAPRDARPYFYLFYSGNALDVGTVMFVARATRIDGPYLKWTERGNWEAQAPDPKIIIRPLVAKSSNSGWYGAGQQTVVVKDGRLYGWYTDVTTCAKAPCNRIMASSTADPTNWPAGQPTHVESATVDVKYDAARSRFSMFSVEAVRGPAGARALRERTSADGIRWSPAENICASPILPVWAHNPGVSGDPAGHLIAGKLIAIYGAPIELGHAYDEDCKKSAPPYCRGYWDLYGTVLDAP